MHGEVDDKPNALESVLARMLFMTLSISQICAANFGDICNAVGQEATERLLVGKKSKSIYKMCIYQFKRFNNNSSVVFSVK